MLTQTLSYTTVETYCKREEEVKGRGIATVYKSEPTKNRVTMATCSFHIMQIDLISGLIPFNS